MTPQHPSSMPSSTPRTTTGSMSSSHANKSTANGRKPNGSAAQRVDFTANLGIDPRQREERARVLVLLKEHTAESVVAQRSCAKELRVRLIRVAEIEVAERLRAALHVQLPQIVTAAVTAAVEQIVFGVERDCYEEYTEHIEELVAGGRWKKEEVA